MRMIKNFLIEESTGKDLNLEEMFDDLVTQKASGADNLLEKLQAEFALLVKDREKIDEQIRDNDAKIRR